MSIKDEWYQVSFADDEGRPNVFKWMVTVMGPDTYDPSALPAAEDSKEGDEPRPSPYADGLFMVSLEFGNTYPTTPPKLKFETPVYHPNIKSDGHVCSDFLSSSWKAALNVRHVIECIRTLLAAPNGADPLNADIGRQFNDDIEAFDKQAAAHTAKYAMD